MPGRIAIGCVSELAFRRARSRRTGFIRHSPQRQHHPEGRAAADPGFHLDPAAHAFDEPPRDGESESGALVAATGAAVALLEFLEQDRQAIFRDAGAGIGDSQRDPRVRSCEAHPDPAGPREFDRVAGEVEQDLPHPVPVADHHARQVVGHVEGDLDALVLGPRRQQLDDALGQPRQVEGLRREVEAPGLDPREIEDAVDQPEQRLATGAHGLDVGALLGIEAGAEHEVGHAEDAIQRRAHLVADGGEEARFRPAGRLGTDQGRVAGPDGLDPGGHVAARPQPVHRIAMGDRHLNEGEPARAPVDGAHLRLEAPHAVGAGLDLAPFQDLQVDLSADEVDGFAAEKPCVTRVGVGDAAADVALDDHFGRGRDERAKPILALGDPPDAVVQALGLGLPGRRSPGPPQCESEGDR